MAPLRARKASSKPVWQRYQFGLECQKCLRRRYYARQDQFGPCPNCGSVVATLVFGRWHIPPEGAAAGEERVRAYRESVRQRNKRSGLMAKVVKIRTRREREEEEPTVPAKASAKPARGGTTRTGAQVEKVKEGRSRQPSGRFIGRTTGLSVTKYQNQTIAENLKKKRTDEEIAKLWRQEFPEATADYTAETVRGVRGLFNKGRHGNDVPNRPIPEFDEDGNALPFRGEKTAARRVAKEDRDEEERGSKKKTTVVKKRVAAR